jgi:hypothetical protein
MKLWHDDIRPAPDGWVWARTNTEAQKLLQTGEVEEISMDHDLGDAGLDEKTIDALTLEEFRRYLMIRGTSSETGVELARWMVLNQIIPDKIIIHSWNPDGARKMAAILEEAGGTCVVTPFSIDLYD